MKSLIYIYITSLIVLFTQSKLNAQSPIPMCGYENEVKKIIERNPNYIEWQNSIFEQASQSEILQNNSKRRLVADTEYYEIPVVFHVVYNNASENVSTAIIMSQFNALNDDFRKRNADTSGIRAIFKHLAADVRIQFKLATIDPDGNATTGITRTSTTRTTFATDANGSYSEDMKRTSNGGKNAWNPARYLNIWICDMDFGPGRQAIVYGFATPPTGAPNWGGTGVLKDTNDVRSGVVLHYTIVGVNNPISPAGYAKGNTATHEIGHYLGLRHIWGDGTNSAGQNNCAQSDGIDDTPFARQSNSTCPSNRNTCIEAVNDMPDMTENYMDYALDVCGAMFTKKQAYMMRYVLENFRTGLPSRQISYDTVNDYTNTEIKIFPNPLTPDKTLNIDITSPSESNFKVKIIDATGRLIDEEQFKSNRLNRIKTEGYAQGLYFVLLADENGTAIKTQKLIIGY